MVNISDDTTWVLGRLSYPVKAEVLENNRILPRSVVFFGGILVYKDDVLTRGTLLAFSGDITKDKLGTVFRDRRTPKVPWKGHH